MKYEYPVKYLSASSIKTYVACPFAWKQKYIKKMRMPSNEHFALGKAVHGAAELQSRFRIKHGKNLPLQAVLEQYQKIATEEAQGLNKYAIKAFREMYIVGHDLVEQLYYYQCQRPPIYVEKQFMLDFGYDLPLKGFIDCIFEDDALRDYKTASKPWERSKLDNELQFTIYYEAFFLLFQRYPKTIGTIELDKKLIITDPRNAIREQLTFRNSSHRERMDLTVNQVLKGIREEKFGRCGKRGCWACSMF